MSMTFERVVTEPGRRTGLPITVAVHSTARGQAIGGCRVAAYGNKKDGLSDALRLASAMTGKCALAGLPHGGGKTVVALPPKIKFNRADLMYDVGDVIASLQGAYATGPDIGTGPADMATIGERTTHVFCRPVENGGSGDSSEHTAAGTLAALKAVAPGRKFAVLGLGRVGAHVVRMLAEQGAELTVSDIDESREIVAKRYGATWVSPEECLTADVDVLVPSAKGGLLTPATVARLRCAVVAGPANNQLDDPSTAELLQERGILWAPDIVVSAGGIIHATAVELRHEPAEQVAARIEGIGTTLASIVAAAGAAGITPDAEARRRVAAALPGRTGNL